MRIKTRENTRKLTVQEKIRRERLKATQTLIELDAIRVDVNSTNVGM